MMRVFPDLLPFWGPYYFYFKVLIWIPLIIRIVVLGPIIKQILVENKQHLTWFLKIIWHTPGLLKSLSFILPGMIVPTIASALFHGGRQFAWDKWEQTPVLAALLYFVGLGLLWTWDYMKIRGIKGKLLNAQVVIKDILEHKKTIDTAFNIQQQLAENVNKTEELRKQKKLNPWLRLKGNISRSLLKTVEKKIEKKLDHPVAEIRSQKVAEGLISQLFMVFWLWALYYIFEHLFFSLISFSIIAAIVYFFVAKYELLAELPEEYLGKKVVDKEITKKIAETVKSVSNAFADEAKLLGKAKEEMTSPEPVKKEQKEEQLPGLFSASPESDKKKN